MSEVLKVARYPATVVLTLNRPECRNALARDLVAALTAALRAAECDEDTRSVIMTGAPPAFCAGLDLREMAETTGKQSEQDAAALLTLYETIDRLPKPVIAAVNGPCVGGGFSLALSCDIRIASDTARFGAAQIARALVPDYGLTFYLPLVIGVSRAMELMCTAEIIGADEAERLGIVSRVVPGDQLMDEARALAEKIAKQAPISIELTKMMVWRSLFDGLARQIDLETGAQQICFTTEDHRGSVKAFLEKKPLPEFKGR